MKSTLILSALLSLSVPAFALDYPGSDRFTDRASGYVVKVGERGSDKTLVGYNPKTKTRFNLAVSPKGRVTGVWEGRQLDYILPASDFRQQ